MIMEDKFKFVVYLCTRYLLMCCRCMTQNFGWTRTRHDATQWPAGKEAKWEGTIF